MYLYLSISLCEINLNCGWQFWLVYSLCYVVLNCVNIPKFFYSNLFAKFRQNGSFHFGGSVMNGASMNILAHVFEHKYIGNYNFKSKILAEWYTNTYS